VLQCCGVAYAANGRMRLVELDAALDFLRPPVLVGLAAAALWARARHANQACIVAASTKLWISGWMSVVSVALDSRAHITESLWWLPTQQRDSKPRDQTYANDISLSFLSHERKERAGIFTKRIARANPLQI
jgi:hypothetical protein